MALAEEDTGEDGGRETSNRSLIGYLAGDFLFPE